MLLQRLVNLRNNHPKATYSLCKFNKSIVQPLVAFIFAVLWFYDDLLMIYLPINNFKMHRITCQINEFWRKKILNTNRSIGWEAVFHRRWELSCRLLFCGCAKGCTVLCEIRKPLLLYRSVFSYNLNINLHKKIYVVVVLYSEETKIINVCI